MKRIQPDIVHLVTIKPVIYGSLAARAARIPAVVAAVSGLGYAFIDQHLEAKMLRKLIGTLYRQAFRHKNLRVIFQNDDDRTTLLDLNALKENQSILIHGSGVDLTHYPYHIEPNATPQVVVMASRLLRDKGVFEYVEAAKALRAQGVQARFLLAGQVDPGNPSSLDEKQLSTWIENQDIEYIGYCDDTSSLFAQVNLVVLPSYREGLPRVLAEAAACGRAVVTTNVPGCRAAIIPNKTGLLVNVRDALSLAEAIHQLLRDDTLRQTMGNEGRQLAENVFDIKKIVAEHMHVYQTLTQKQHTTFLQRHTKPLTNRQIARVSTIPFPMLTQLRPQLKAINEAGGEITLIASNDELGNQLNELDHGVFKPISMAREIKIFADLITLFRLWHLFRKQRFDIVHSITPKAGLLCAIAARAAGVPIRLHTFTGQPWVTMHGIKKTLIQRCDQFISTLNTQCYTDSVSQQEFLIRHNIIHPQHLKVLGSGSLAGIDLARFNSSNFTTTENSDFKTSLGLQQETLIFIFVGRVTEDKGIYELLDSTSQLLKQGHDIALLIVGPFEQQLQCEIPTLFHQIDQHKIIYTGFSREPERYMAIADVLCIPSYREGFGTVVIEAAAMGLPTIGTNIYGLSDAVIDGETGLLVEPKNVTQLTLAMQNLIDNPQLRTQLGENAKKRALSEFDSKKCGELLIAEYQHLLRKASTSDRKTMRKIRL